MSRPACFFPVKETETFIANETFESRIAVNLLTTVPFESDIIKCWYLLVTCAHSRPRGPKVQTRLTIPFPLLQLVTVIQRPEMCLIPFSNATASTCMAVGTTFCDCCFQCRYPLPRSTYTSDRADSGLSLSADILLFRIVYMFRMYLIRFCVLLGGFSAHASNGPWVFAPGANHVEAQDGIVF